MVTSLMLDMKTPSTKNDYQPWQMEKFIQILDKTKSLPTIIILDQVFISPREIWRGMVKINVEKGWLRGILPLLFAKWKKIAFIVNHEPINWTWGWQTKSLEVLTFHPVSISFCHPAFLLQCLQGLSCLFCLAFTPV